MFIKIVYLFKIYAD